ncbi:hypothetical protein [Halofilum ochraceum]|uniref:hypothetical protein n=1 Tax=Halofilum ochraceum TaxID=1611323 RepID=UPI0011131BA6|nr:hypothetical protein [Halofilum ochraceum]
MNAKPMNEQAEEGNEVLVDFALDNAICRTSRKCSRMVGKSRERLGNGNYISGKEDEPPKVVAAVLRLSGVTHEQYREAVRKRSKGESLRQAKKAEKFGIRCAPFDRRLFVPDIHEINESKAVRSGGAMRDSYHKTVEELGGWPDSYHRWSEPACTKHYDIWWGAFESVEGYSQGRVQTDEKLVAYIDLRRLGNFALYSLIIGHGDYLKTGVMYRLHLAIMEWLLDPNNPHATGLDYLVYAGFYQGGEGLQHWKRKFLFEPARMYEVERDESDQPDPKSETVIEKIRRAGKTFLGRA